MCAGPWRVPNATKPRMPTGASRSETVGAKIHRREGNSPDRQLRAPSAGFSGKGGRCA